SIVHSDVFGAALVGRADQLGDIPAFGYSFAHPAHLFCPGSVNIGVEDVLLLLQDALGAPAYHHTIALLMCFADETARQLRHGLGIEASRVVHCRNPFETAVPQGAPAHAMKPGIDPLVEAAGKFGVHPRGAGDLDNEIVVEQLPPKAVGGDACDLASATA